MGELKGETKMKKKKKKKRDRRGCELNFEIRKKKRG